MSKPSRLAKLKLCLSTDQLASTQAEKSRLQRANNIIYGSKQTCQLSIGLLFVRPLRLLKSAFYHVAPCNARAPPRHLPKERQLTRSQKKKKNRYILSGLNAAWLQRRGTTEPSCRRRKRAGLHADGETKTSEGPRQRKIKLVQSFSSTKTQLC